MIDFSKRIKEIKEAHDWLPLYKDDHDGIWDTHEPTLDEGMQGVMIQTPWSYYLKDLEKWYEGAVAKNTDRMYVDVGRGIYITTPYIEMLIEFGNRRKVINDKIALLHTLNKIGVNGMTPSDLKLFEILNDDEVLMKHIMPETLKNRKKDV